MIPVICSEREKNVDPLGSERWTVCFPPLPITVSMKIRILNALSIALAALISGNVIASDDVAGVPPIPAMAKVPTAFVPEGWEETSLIEADLNGDQRDDAVIVITWTGPLPDNTEFAWTRHVLVLALRQEDGSLKRSAVSDRAVLDNTEGGLLGDPFQELRVERGAVVIEHYGGSRNRWGITTRFRSQNGRWMLIGRTDEETDTAYPDLLDKVDHNLSTGLVIRNFRSGGLREEELYPAQRALLKHPEVRYWRLPAPLMSKAPPLEGTPASSDWGFGSLTLNRKEQVIANPELWKGPADLSARLQAVGTTEGLFLRAEVTDDQATSQDRVRLTNQHGDEIEPGTKQRTAIETGYVMGMFWSKARLRAALGEDTPYWLDPRSEESDEATEMEEIPVVIEILDVDSDQPRTTLSTRPIGAPYAAGILICDPSELVLGNQ
jgi:hypothetical protein